MSELAFDNTPATPSTRASDFSAVFYREYALLTRNRVNLILGLAPTLVYLLLVNSSLTNVVGEIDYRGTRLSFGLFLLPMALAMSVVGASGTTGVALFQEEMSGVSTQLWSYPLRRSRFLLGKLSAGVTLVLAQTVLALIVGTFVFHYGLGLLQWLSLVVTLVLASVAFNGLFLAGAILIRDYRTFMVITSISVPVLVFAAPSFSPANDLPTVLRWVSVVNPVTYAVDGLRDAAVFGFPVAWPSLLVLLGLAIVGNGVASRALLRRSQNL